MSDPEELLLADSSDKPESSSRRCDKSLWHAVVNSVANVTIYVVSADGFLRHLGVGGFQDGEDIFFYVARGDALRGIVLCCIIGLCSISLFFTNCNTFYGLLTESKESMPICLKSCPLIYRARLAALAAFYKSLVTGSSLFALVYDYSSHYTIVPVIFGLWGTSSNVCYQLGLFTKGSARIFRCIPTKYDSALVLVFATGYAIASAALYVNQWVNSLHELWPDNFPPRPTKCETRWDRSLTIGFAMGSVPFFCINFLSARKKIDGVLRGGAHKDGGASVMENAFERSAWLKWIANSFLYWAAFWRAAPSCLCFATIISKLPWKSASYCGLLLAVLSAHSVLICSRAQNKDAIQSADSKKRKECGNGDGGPEPEPEPEP